MVPKHPESMHTVVARLRDEKVDTDGDGKLDVDELAIGSDPSDPDPRKEICGPTYGCGAHIAVAPPASVSRSPALCWLAAALGLGAFVAVRRRRG